MHGYLVGLEASVVQLNAFFFNLSLLLSHYLVAYTHVHLVVCSCMHGYLGWLEASVILFSEFLKFIATSESLSSCIHSRLLKVCSSMHGYLVVLEASVVLFNEILKFITSADSLSSSIHARPFGSMQ